MQQQERPFEPIGDGTDGPWRSLQIAETARFAHGVDARVAVAKESRFARMHPLEVPVRARAIFGADNWLASDDGHAWRFDLIVGKASHTGWYDNSKLATATAIQLSGRLVGVMYAGVDRASGFVHAAMLKPIGPHDFAISGAGSFDPVATALWARPPAQVLRYLIESASSGKPLPGDPWRRVCALAAQVDRIRPHPLVDPRRIRQVAA